MTSPSTQPLSATLVRPLRSGAESAAATAARGRRRRALLKLAERRGEVRVALRETPGVRPGSADALELLDELNERGLLRYGGLRRSATLAEIVYRPA